MGFTENVVFHLAKQTVKNKKLTPNKCKLVISDKKDTEDMYIFIDGDDQKRYGNIFHYGKLGYDKYVLYSKLKKLRFLKRNIERKEE